MGFVYWLALTLCSSCFLFLSSGTIGLYYHAWFLVLGMEPRDFLLLGKHSTHHVLPSSQIHGFFWVFWDRVLPCNPGWPGPHYVAKAGLKPMAIFLPQPPKYRFIGLSHHIWQALGFQPVSALRQQAARLRTGHFLQSQNPQLVPYCPSALPVYSGQCHHDFLPSTSHRFGLSVLVLLKTLASASQNSFISVDV